MMSVIERTPTGIEGLDELIEGGFPNGHAILVCGGPGAGKTTFGIQFLVKGIEEYGEPGLYVSLGEPADYLKVYMLRFGWDLDSLAKKGLLNIIEFPPAKLHEISISGLANLIRISSFGVKRIVIDCITTLEFNVSSRKGSLS